MMPRNSSPIIEKEVVCTYKIKLEKVLGVTVRNNAALDSNPTCGGTVAYPAGCTVVLFDTKTEKQSHIVNTSRKSITSLAFSSCGRYLVTGECGHQPAVRVWDLQSEPQSNQPGLAPQPQQVAEFFSHKYGINCVAFSPTNKCVVSIGTQHDMIVNVWDWRNNIKVASNKVSTKVKALAFAENGSYFVTVGNRHVKFWFLECGKAKFSKEAVPLMGRSAILGEQRNNYFCDVACGKAQCGDSTYAITRSGLLCEFNNRRLLDKWVELRTTSANCIAVGEDYIFVGCAEGIIRCFNPSTLQFVTTLPRTHYLGVDVSLGTSIASMAAVPPDAKYPDTIAITYDEKNHKLTSIYNDHSIYVWDVYHITRVGKSYSYLYHSACIWGVEMAPPNSPLPPGSFLTCSSDDTIRVWTLEKLNERNSRGMYRRNVYSNELIKVVYIDRDLTYLKDLDISTTNPTSDKQESSYDGRNGVRAIRISPDGKNLASGDRSGNIRIHETVNMNQLCKIEAHDAEVLCLEYTGPDCDQKLMASASRDRLIHVFDVRRDYDFLQTLDDHSSSITAVRFLVSQKKLQMVSCGADKSLIFRSLSETSNRIPQFTRSHNATGKTTLYDMEVDVGQKHVVLACQDRNVRIYSASSGKHTKSFKGSSGDDGTLIKVALDRTGIYLATSCTDKSLSVYDYYSGECMATMSGHSELVTGLRFTNDCRRLISASGDGCIFVWRIPHDMVVTMHARLSQQALRQGKTLDQEILENPNVDYYDANQNSDDSSYRFSVGQLPLWAKKHISEDTSPPSSFTKGVCVPKGRWAQRAERTVGVKSFYTDSVIPFPSLQVENRLDSDGSKDSSIDSGTETRQYSEMRHENMIIKQDADFLPCPESYNEITCNETQRTMSNITIRESTRRGLLTDDSALGSLRDPDVESNAHDGDIDSDQEYRHQPLYYPTQIDSASGSEFTITNIDADELRKSQRRLRRANLVPVAIPNDGAQESEDDDDEASTPSGDNTDRNPMSFLSASSESLDQIVTREKYLQSTFESLSGAEYELTPVSKSTISSQFLTRGSGVSSRNVAVINAVKQTKNDPEAIKKREELNKRIAETKKKLQSVGRSPLKYSQSIHDLSHIPEKDKWSSPGRNKQGNESNVDTYDRCKRDRLYCSTNDPVQTSTNTDYSHCGDDSDGYLHSSFSVPTDLQLCGCFMKELNEMNDFLNSKREVKRPSPENRKLQLDKTLMKYKLHKSLPVSPVSEERSFVDFVENASRKSFSYFIDFDKDATDEGFKQVCSDIQKFSDDFNRKYEEIEETFGVLNEAKDEDGNFSSDSLEDYSFRSVANKKASKTVNPAPRRCVSNNELSMYCNDIPKSESFYLNPNASQESVLSDEFGYKSRSYCNSLESVLSNESDCKSAPLEALFNYQKSAMVHSQSLPSDVVKNVKTIETQTDLTFDQSLEVLPAKKTNASDEFKQKLLKFEKVIAQNESKSPQKKPIAFFIETKMVPKKSHVDMYIPSLESKNKQYKSKFCNVLNNRPEFNTEIYTEGAKNTKMTNFNASKNTKTKNTAKVQETSSLDRHLFTKSLLESEKVCHKPPRPVRRHSSKTHRTKTVYEYVRKEDIKSVPIKNVLNNQIGRVSKENTIEVTYKEKNLEKDLETSNKNDYLNELYDSLDKTSVNTKIEHDSLEINLDGSPNDNIYDSLEVDPKNICSRPPQNVCTESAKFNKPHKRTVFDCEIVDGIQFALENIKILNEIQRKIHKINNLVDVFKSNMCSGKVRALSSMYESLTNSNSYYNDLTKLETTPIRFRRRNLSLPNFVERHLNYECNKGEDSKKNREPPEQVALSSDRFDDNSLRKSCSLSDLSVQLLPTVPKRKGERGGGDKFHKPQMARNGSCTTKSQMTRSSSIGVLNQSDSENEGREKKLQSRLMRPTISSQNKVANNNKNLQNRKRQSYSATNLNTLVTGDVSTSDDDADKIQENRQPIAAPRRHQSNKDKKMKTNRNLVSFERKKSVDYNNEDHLDNLDVSTVQLSTQLCDEVALQLTKAANNVVELYRRLTDTDANTTEQIASVHKTDMVKNLEMSIIRTQKMLQDLTFEKLKANNGVVDVNQTDTVKKLNDLVSRGIVNDPNNIITLMQQYSDILLGMMQQKIQNSNT